MERRSLDIKVTSAKGLKKDSKMDVFVAVKLYGDPKCSDHLEQRTQVARNSGTSPKWSNGFMKFPIDQTLAEANRLVITLKIKSEQRGGGEKDIGEVHVPVKDLWDHLGNDKTGQRYVTYQIGKSKSDISFTYSFTDQVVITNSGGCSRYPAPEQVRPAATHPPVLNRPVVSQLLPNVGSCSCDHVPSQPVLNRPILSQLLPSVGSFSYNHVPSQPPVYPPPTQPEILPPAFFPGLYPPHGYPMSYIPGSPPIMCPPIFPGLSCPSAGYPTVAPPQTQPGLYPPMNPHRF